LPTEESLQIEKLVYGGEGLARLDGRVVLTPYVLPGETVRVSIEPVKKDLLRGRLLDVATASPARVAAACPYFQRCGGCQYQHAEYSAQLENKIAILREVLKRLAKIEFDGEIAAVQGEPWGYRNRIQLHIERGEVGYFEHGSRRLCSVDRCPVASPVLNQAIAKLSEAKMRFSGGVELFTNESDVQYNLLDRAPRDVFSVLSAMGTSGAIEYGGFRVSRNSFFQVNRFLVDALVGAAAADESGQSAIDLYAGTGLFSRRLAGRFQKVIAVEAGLSAFRDLEHNLAGSIQAENSGTEEYLARFEGTADFILADPPRAGLGPVVVKELTRIGAAAVTIVSCDPATLARDLKGLMAGGYRIDKLTLVDLFPQTFHVETVARLTRE